VKTISRFARNTVDLLDTVRRLKSLGIEVIFHEEDRNRNDLNNHFQAAAGLECLRLLARLILQKIIGGNI
jgi:DNA invertase Pin-like site-specific DNA recombinase